MSPSSRKIKPPVRLIDVARMAGVSVGAAANVLTGVGASTIRVGEKTAARVRVAADKLGYQPNQAARAMRGKPSKTIAVLTIHTAPPVESRRILHLERLAWDAGYHLLVHRSWQHDSASMKRLINSLRARQVDGLIVLAKISERQYRGSNAEFAPLPTVFHGWSVCSPEEAAVIPDVVDGTSIGVDHLVARGRRRIAAIFHGNSPRTQAWRDALMRNGIPVDETLRYIHESSWEHIPSDTDCTRVVEKVLAARADAILAENDMWALGILRQLRRRGVRVPEDIALVGYNNLAITPLVYPSITTIDEQDELQARAMFDGLMTLLNGAHPAQVVIPARLVQRESS